MGVQFAWRGEITFYQVYQQFAYIMNNSGFVLLLEVLEKPWNLILDFKGAWEALEKKNFVENCLKTPLIFAWVKIVEIASC